MIPPARAAVGRAQRPASLAGRLVVLACVWSLVLIAAGGLTLSWIFSESVKRSFDERLEVLMQGLIAVSEIGPDGRLVVGSPPGEPRFRAPLSGWYWQVETPDGLIRSRSLWDTDLPKAAVPLTHVRGPGDQRLRMLSRAILMGDTVYRFRVAGETDAITRATARFTVTVAAALAVLGVGLVLAVLAQVTLGLRPLARLQAEIQRVRAGEAERLDGTFPRELAPVVDELNSLLAHNQEVIERARAHGGNLAHALKTPLSILANEAERGNDRRLAEATRRQLPRMERLINHHLARARMAGAAGALTGHQPIRPVLGELVRTLSKLHGAKHLVIRRTDDVEVTFFGEREDLLEMLGNLMDNACKWAERRVEVTVVPAQDGFDVHVDDDGPGLPEVERLRAIERGRRLDESVPGSGLGLAIVADHAKLYRGRLLLDQGPLGGLRATLHLPGQVQAPNVAPSA
ncbi:MAG: histidine kinase [Geminicoccaceae bacterium]|nr:MAG: histidine kinase [Geminicoccaceae bacterium]